MIQPGVFINQHTVRFGCVVPGPLAAVWNHLTSPILLRHWLAEAALEPCNGGWIELRFDVGEAPVCADDGAVILGVISRYERPYHLSYSWIDAPRGAFKKGRGHVLEARVSFDLEQTGEGVNLVLTHSDLPREVLCKYAAGWHAHLELLQARLLHLQPLPLVTAFQDYLGQYQDSRVGVN